MHRVARQSYLQFAGALANGLFGFLMVLIAAHILGKDGVGAYIVGIGLFQIVANLAQLGADTGLLRMIPRYRALGRQQDVRRTIAIALVPVAAIGIVLAIVVIFAAPFLARILTHHQDPAVVLPYVRIFALFLPLAAVTTVSLAGTRGYGTVVPYVSVENIGKPASRPILLLAVAALGMGTVGVAMTYAIPVFIGAVAAVFWLLTLEERAWKRERFDRSAPRSYGSLSKEFWRFSSPRALQGFFGTAFTWLDTLLLAGFRSTGQAGVYTAATRFLLVGTAAARTVINVISPQISAFLARGEKDRAEAVYQTSTWWLMIFTWPAYLTMAIYAPLLLRIYPRGFESGQTALVILTLAGLGSMATGAVGAVLLMGGYSVANLVIGIATLVLNIGLNLWLIPPHGMTGAAIAWAAAILFSNGATFILVLVRMKMSPLGKGFAVVVVTSLVCYGGIGLAVRSQLGVGLVSFVTDGVIATAVYFAVLYRFRRLLHLSVLKDAFKARSSMDYGKNRRAAAVPIAEPTTNDSSEDQEARAERLEQTLSRLSSTLADLRVLAQNNALSADARIAEIIEQLRKL